MQTTIKTVFISRSAAQSKVFIQCLAEKNIAVEAQSLIRFSARPFELVLSDWIFFYSKTGVEYFFSQLKDKQALAQVKFAALGAATAAAVETYSGRMADFVGTGSPEETAAEFSILAGGQRVLFARAADSKQSVQELLKEQVNVLEIIVYDNVVLEEIPQINADVLVFTSPLNVKAYFSKNSIRIGQYLVAIGNTTAAELRNLGFTQMIVASTPDEKSLADAVLQLV